MTLSQRTVRLAVLATWSGCLLLLWLGGEVDRYLGPRTAWIVPVGAIVLTLVSLAYAAASADGPAARTGISGREGLRHLALLAPVLVLFTLANASLGSLAASRKLTTRGLDLTRLAGKLAGGSPETSFLALNVAAEHPDRAREYGIRPGGLVRLQGFVLNPARAPGGAFRLARLYITCCVADAIALSADVDPAVRAPVYARDQWVEADGTLERRARGLVVRAVRVRAIAKPRHPYQTFSQ